MVLIGLFGGIEVIIGLRTESAGVKARSEVRSLTYRTSSAKIRDDNKFARCRLKLRAKL